jgi:four helix bundle protein
MDAAESCRRLEMYRLAHELAVRVHAMTFALPSHELYEEGAQVRSSSRRVVAGIVEGYALRRYRDEFLHYLYRSLGSADETHEHLRLLHETGSLQDASMSASLRAESGRLSGMILRFIQGVEIHHSAPEFVRRAREARSAQGYPE